MTEIFIFYIINIIGGIKYLVYKCHMATSTFYKIFKTRSDFLVYLVFTLYRNNTVMKQQ